MRIDIEKMRKPVRALEWSLLWIGPLLLVIGFVAERMWRSLPSPRALDTSLLAALALGLSMMLGRLLRISMATAITAIFSVALVYFVGLAATLSVTLLSATALAVGSWIAKGSGLLSLVAGIAAISGALGWLLPVPVHFRFVYFLLLLTPAIAERRRIVAGVYRFFTDWRSAVAASPRSAAFAMLVLGITSAGCWLPTVQFDDLAYHLGLPSQLSALGYYRLDVQSQMWALAPWSGDVVQAIAQVMAGAEARGAIDALWLCLVAALTWQLVAKLHAPRFAQWLAVALVASQPLLAALVGGMQAELPATAGSLALALAVMSADDGANAREIVRFAFIAALLVGLKTGFLAIVIPLTFWMYCRWRGQWTLAITLSGCAAFVVACASSYCYAALITGDPLFPIFSDAFHARFAADSLSDTRWTAPVDLTIPWRLTFETARFHEGWNGAAGFSLLGLLGATIVALFSKRSRALTMCALLAFIAAITTVHYFRYTFPALALITVASVPVVAAIAPARHAIALIGTVIVLNLAYQSCALWTLHVGGIKHRLTHRDTPIEVEHFAPERSLARLANEQNPRANVLLCSPDRPFAAELAGRGFTTSHYDPELDRLRIAADGDPSGAGWRRIFDRTNAQYAIVSTPTAHDVALAAALNDAQLVREIDSAQLWKLPERANIANDFADDRDMARQKFRP